jgi:hypothetical protein
MMIHYDNENDEIMMPVVITVMIVLDANGGEI